MPQRRPLRNTLSAVLTAGVLLAAAGAASAQPDDFMPVTDAMLQDPADGDWLMWRRTLDGWGYSPLDQIDRDNVADLRLVWTRALNAGSQQGTPLAYRGVLYMPNPGDVIQAIDAATGDLIWEHRRDLPDDLAEHMGGLATTKRAIAIHGRLLLDTTGDDYLMALDAVTGEMVWETQVLDYTENPALQTAGPIVAGGKVISGRSCRATATPDACVVTAHDARTGEELWRRRTIPGPGEPGDETWGDVPFERRKHVGTWMVPSYDPELNLIYIGTSVTSPAPKFMLGGPELAHLYHNSTLALDADTGEIVWYYQHLNDDWDLDHPFERLLVDTAVTPDPDAVAWINPRLRPSEERRVMTGIPGKTGVVYTLDRETGEFLWANPTVAQNVITHIDGATGDVTENAEVIFSALGQELLACPSWAGGKDWESVHGSAGTSVNTEFIGYFVDGTRQKPSETVSFRQKRLAVWLAVQKGPAARHLAVSCAATTFGPARTHPYPVDPARNRRMPTVSAAVASTVPTIQRMSLVSRLAISVRTPAIWVESRVSRFAISVRTSAIWIRCSERSSAISARCSAISDLTSARPALNWSDVTWSPRSVNSRRASVRASAWAGVKSAAVSDRATACVSSIRKNSSGHLALGLETLSPPPESHLKTLVR